MKTRIRPVHSSTLLRIFNRIKRNPLKIFTRVELGVPAHNDSYTWVLIHLGLIEEVRFYYDAGKGVRRNGTGFRLIRKEEGYGNRN